jgi:hypothetical protein
MAAEGWMSMITSYIIAIRNPRTNKLVLVTNDDETVCEFESERDAMIAADNTSICKAWGYEVIEVSA